MSTFDDFVRDFVPFKPNFSLAEVEEITGFSVQWLGDGCRAGQIEHQWAGRRRVLTRPQLLKLLADTLVEPKPARPADPEAARIEEHRQKVAARLAKKAGAA